MARRGSNRSDADAFSPSLTALRLFRPIQFTTVNYRYLDLAPIEDRRQFHPHKPYQPAKLLSGNPASVVIKRPSQKFQKPYGYVPTHTRFAVPEETVVCLRRAKRREVLFAKNKTGKGRSRKRPHKSYWSSISCKR